MALYVGEAVRIRASALDPETREPLTPRPISAHVHFYHPDKNPARDPEVRDDSDFGPIEMGWREATQDFAVFVSTDGSGWVPGRWSYRVTVQGNAYENFEFGTFRLRE